MTNEPTQDRIPNLGRRRDLSRRDDLGVSFSRDKGGVLTIQEAINSGKEFKRKEWVNWYGACSDKHGFYLDSFVVSGTARSSKHMNISSEDLLADDWEIKREPRQWEVAFMVNGSCREQVLVREVFEAINTKE